MLSTVILNWNRSDLLRVTVESYRRTMDSECELSIVDNASTDDSREYLGQLEKSMEVKIFYMDENIGGEAYNIAIPSARGDLIHLSENDSHMARFSMKRWTMSARVRFFEQISSEPVALKSITLNSAHFDFRTTGGSLAA